MTDWIRNLIEQLGPLGVALLMIIENVFPPIPSELVMPLAGYLAAREGGGGHLALTVAAGSAGSLLGTLAWYYAGRALTLERVKRLAAAHGRWLTVAPEDVGRAERWYRRHGAKSVLLGRMIPAIRTLVSLPAGIFCMPLGRFLLLSGIGTVLWTGLLAGAGFALEDRYTTVERWLSPVGNGIFAVLVAWYAYRVVTFRRS